MARLTLPHWLSVNERFAWECRRAWRWVLRRLGWGSLCIYVALLAVIPAWFQLQRASDEFQEVRKQLQSALPQLPEEQLQAASAHQRLRQFQEHLLPYEDIPTALQALFTLAENDGLILQRGEYKVEADQAGGFVRYRMVLPVKGDAQAIYRFMQSALLAQKTLALDSVQFRRERAEASELEARIHWLMLVHPAQESGTATGGRP